MFSIVIILALVFACFRLFSLWFVECRLQFAASKSDKKDFFGKSDPYLVISKSVNTNQFVPVMKTEIIKNTLGKLQVSLSPLFPLLLTAPSFSLFFLTDPSWKPFTVTVQQLCSGDYDKPITFECWDWNRSGSHELIGSFKVCGCMPVGEWECLFV